MVPFFFFDDRKFYDIPLKQIAGQSFSFLISLTGGNW